MAQTKKSEIDLKQLAQATGGVYVEAAPKFVDETIRLFKKVGFNPVGETQFDFDTSVVFTKETDSGITYAIKIAGKAAIDGVVSKTTADLRKLRDALKQLGKSVELVNNVDLGI